MLFTANWSAPLPLAELIHEKTTGNPFFAIQFVSALAEEGLLSFDYGEGRWVWDLNRIHAKGYTDNVVELLVGKLNRLPIGDAEGTPTVCLYGQQRRVRHAADGLSGIDRRVARPLVGSSLHWPDLPLGAIPTAFSTIACRKRRTR